MNVSMILQEQNLAGFVSQIKSQEATFVLQWHFTQTFSGTCHDQELIEEQHHHDPASIRVTLYQMIKFQMFIKVSWWSAVMLWLSSAVAQNHCFTRSIFISLMRHHSQELGFFSVLHQNRSFEFIVQHIA